MLKGNRDGLTPNAKAKPQNARTVQTQNAVEKSFHQKLLKRDLVYQLHVYGKAH
jgi:hypothetical protein